MTFISNDYSVRAPPVTIVPTSAGATVLDLQPDPSLRTIGRSTASRSNAAGRTFDSPALSDGSSTHASLSEAATDDVSQTVNRAPSRPRSSVDLYRSTQRNAGTAGASRRIDLYA